MGRERTLRSIFRITVLRREELAGHVVAMEKLPPPISLQFMIISFIVLFCFGRAEGPEVVLQSTTGVRRWRPESIVP